MGTMAQMATVSSQTQRGTCSRRLRLGYLRFPVLLSGACIAVHCANRALHCVLRSSPSRSARSIHCILHRPSAHGRHYLRLAVERPRLSSHSLCVSVCLSVCLSLALLLHHLPLPPFFVRTVLSALHQATSPSPRTALGERHPVSTGQGHEGFSGGMADISIVSLTRSVDVLLHGRVLSPFDSEQGVSQHKPCMWAAAALQARAVCMPALGLYLCQALAP